MPRCKMRWSLRVAPWRDQELKPRECVLQGRKWLMTCVLVASDAAHAKGRSPCKAYSAGFCSGATGCSPIDRAPMSVAALQESGCA